MRWLARRPLPPAAGAAVMATGIVSTGLLDAGWHDLSLAFFAAGVLAWLAIVAPLIVRLLREGGRLARGPDTPAWLTTVAATAVLGQRLLALGFAGAADAALALAVLLWLPLTCGLLRPRDRDAAGSWFMLVVAAEAVAALAAVAASHEHAPWLVAAAIAAWAFGLAAYGWVLAGFDLRELRAGAGDHWVAGGALAIAALAGADAASAAAKLPSLHGFHRSLEIAATAVWVAAAVWLPVLVVQELRWQRLRYDLRRWATVFPLGMYAASASRVGGVDGFSALGSFARGWIWVAVAAWLAVLAGAALSGGVSAPQQARQARQP